MGEYQLGAAEEMFADLIWENEPIGSMDLVRLCEKQLGWKKSTTFTVLKRLSEKGFFKNENSIVTSLISKEELAELQGEKLVRERFDGSLPAFVAAFTRRKKLSKEEIAEIRRIIEEN